MPPAVTAPLQSAASFARSLPQLRAAGHVRLDDTEAAALAAAVDEVAAASARDMLYGKARHRAEPNFSAMQADGLGRPPSAGAHPALRAWRLVGMLDAPVAWKPEA